MRGGAVRRGAHADWSEFSLSAARVRGITPSNETSPPNGGCVPGHSAVRGVVLLQLSPSVRGVIGRCGDAGGQ
ncbi:hypothetical protein YT1_1102 [Rhodococcus ruber]|nr:hypothetical protein YT1_1102 [Rhodococcus ruber]